MQLTEPTTLKENRESDQKVIKELSLENLDWKNKLHKPNEWSKKKLEEQRRVKALREENSLLAEGKSSFRIKRIKKSDDKNIHHVTVIFPLPSKDPLLAHRKAYDYAQVFETGDRVAASIISTDKHE
jgi:hypothetical protein